MTTYRVLITDHPWNDCDIERRLLMPSGGEVIDAPAADEATLVDLARQADVIATCWAEVTPDVIRAAPDCRLIARLGIGLDNIAIPTATELGIPVTNIPDYCVEEVATHALAMLLALARGIGFFHLRTKRGEYNLRAAPELRRLSGQTLGLVGFGRTAQALRERALALGLQVIAQTPSGRDFGTGCPMVPFEELLTQSDFVSLHAPLNSGTRHLIDAAALARMKDTACLINTSRGALVDQAALWEALQGGRLGGAALDVFEPEPPDLSQPLFRDERVIVTPHAAFVSREALIELRKRVAGQILDVVAGRRPENIVNPEVWAAPDE